MPQGGRRRRASVQTGSALIGQEPINCTRCHAFGGVTESDDAPVLQGWGSKEWMLGMLHDPRQEAYYPGDEGEMPAFGAEEILTDAEMSLVVDWLRRDWYVPPEQP